MMKVLLDAFGGDNAPSEIILGGIKAVNEFEDLQVVFVGKSDVIKQELAKCKYNENQVDIIDCNDVITNDDVPTVAIRQKKDSSIVVALDHLRTDDSFSGFVSAGPTGAILTGGFLKIGRIQGVSRPACCPLVPTMNGGQVALIDSGANMDCKPENLVHFAIMASTYMHDVFGIEKPRIALLSVGTEDHKGNELIKQVFPILKELKEINFVGNMESRDFLSGNYDVVVADGFSGNVLLKSTEGAIMSLLHKMKSEIKASTSAKIGYLFMKKVFKNIKTTLDYNGRGGAVLLGCKKLIVKCHGAAKAQAIYGGIKQIIDMSNAKLCEHIELGISKMPKVDFENE